MPDSLHLSIVSFVVMCLAFIILGEMSFNVNSLAILGWLPAIVRQLLHHTKSGEKIRETPFYTFIALAVAAVLAELTITGNHVYAALCLFGAWLFTAIAAVFGFSVLSKIPRIAYTAITWSASAVVFLWLYFVTCPTLIVSPPDVTFNHVGELYSFRVENKSDHDTYMNSFVFYLDSSAYSTDDFDIQVAQDSLKPLAQQLDGVDYGVPDIFGEIGFVPESTSRHFFLLHVYHLAPHETRQLSIKLKQHEISTNQTVNLSSEVMSSSNKAVPVTKDGIVVYVPALITRRLALTGFLICYLKEGAHIPCDMRRSTKPPLVIPVGCISLAVVSEREQIPNKILAGKCDP